MIKKEEIHQIFNNFNNQNVLIIGDVMIDSYLWGKVDRISPEAPVPIVAVSKREERMGGAANVALNIQALGANPILCTVIGNDVKADSFLKLLEIQKLSNEGIIKSDKRITTVKFRVIGNNAQMLRVDEEIDTNISTQETNELFERIKKLIDSKNIKVIIFEDYDKGVITPELIKNIVEYSKKQNIPIVVDPKKRNFLFYKNVTLFKPNLKELKEGLKIDFNNKDALELSNAVKKLQELLDIDIALVTLSESGVYINRRLNNDGKFSGHSIPAHMRNIADVSGAGDTVISVAALCLAQKLSDFHIAAISNLAGGLVCEEVGVVPINKEKLLKETITILS